MKATASWHDFVATGEILTISALSISTLRELEIRRLRRFSQIQDNQSI